MTGSDIAVATGHLPGPPDGNVNCLPEGGAADCTRRHTNTAIQEKLTNTITVRSLVSTQLKLSRHGTLSNSIY